MRLLTDFVRSGYTRIKASIGRDAPPKVPADLPSTETQNADLEQFELARTFQQQGQLEKAEAIFLELLQKYPKDFDLPYQLGLVHGQRNNFTAAVGFLEQAIAIDPSSAPAHCTLGNCLKGLRQHEAALASYDKALALRPNDADTLSNRGATLQDLKQSEEALKSYERALAIDPDHVLALDNRGTALRELKRPEEALASHDRALAVNPDYAPAHYNRGLILGKLKRYAEALVSLERALALNPHDTAALCNHGAILHSLKRYEDALASYDRTLILQPNHAEALVNRGASLRELNRHEDALECFDRLLKLNPDHAVAHFSRGISLGDLRRYEEALASYDRALALQPDYVEAHNNRATMLRELQRHEEALSSYDTALAINPDHLSALFNRGNLLVDFKKTEDAVRDYARLVALDADYNFAQSHLLHAKISCCDWRDLTAIWNAIADGTRQGKKTAEPFYCLGICSSADFLKRCAEIYSADRILPTKIKQEAPSSRRKGRIRIGYVAGEFRHQATSILMVELFERHDAHHFESFAFDNGWDDGSDIRKRLQNAASQIVDISRLNDVEAATEVRNKEIDILVDLNGYFGLGRTGVFSHRPAPIQINWLGFPGTMGVPYMDYIIGDAHVIPAGHEDYYTEKVVRLPDTYQVNDSKRAISARTPTRAEVGLPDSGFVFCCFNNNYKITPDIFDIWMRLLSRVEHSVLWLLEDNAAASRNLRAEADARGIAPGRLVFAPRMSLPDHLARHRLADLFLDTLPCNAHTTASDALWAGLPLLTCMGATFAGRVAGSLLHAVGLPELITDNRANYEALALKLATTPASLLDLRTRLARNRTTHPLFDSDRFRKHIEAAYVAMYERWLQGEAPHGFVVPSIA